MDIGMNLVVCTCYSGPAYEWYVARNREIQPDLIALEVSHLSEPKLGKMEVLLEQFASHDGPTLFIDADTILKRRLVAEDFLGMDDAPIAGVSLHVQACQLIAAGVLDVTWMGSINSGVLYFPRPAPTLVQEWQSACLKAIESGNWMGDEIELLRVMYRKGINPRFLHPTFNVPTLRSPKENGPLIAHDIGKFAYMEAHRL